MLASQWSGLSASSSTATPTVRLKLAKYRFRITAARNNLGGHATMLEQIAKYAKRMPNSAYEQLVRAECALMSGDVDGASRHLEDGTQLKEVGIDRMEIVMWRAVLAYLAGKSQASLE